jgi:hypothetical protein
MLPRLSGMPRTCPSNSCTTRRGIPANYRQISDQGGQLRPELALCFPGQFRLCRFAAFRTVNTLALIFGDVRFDRWQFGHLMPPRLTLRGHLPG